jgi:hypothetical protein
MSLTTDARKAGEAMVAQGRAAIGDARKPFYAWVGASDLAFKRIAAIQTEAQVRAKRLQEAAGDLPDKAQQITPAGVRAVAEAYGEQAKDAYDYFARRGAQVVAQVRRSPDARRTEARFEQVMDDVDATAETAKDKTHKASASARRTGRAATARKSAPRRSGSTTKSTTSKSTTTKSTTSKPGDS